jgi:Fe-Mn family superoxide dismutase
MEIHHDKHHGAYVDKLNAAIKDIKELERKTIEEILANLKLIPEGSRQTVINNGGGHANHSMFWEIMAPANDSKPEGELAKNLNTVFGGFESFKEKFTEKSMSLFGSGWVFLIADKNGKISLKRHSFQNSPYMDGNIPLMGLDLWEHAYYLKYQNKRADYISAWWNVVNWKEINNRYNKLLKK